jgi:hypothetical protein
VARGKREMKAVTVLVTVVWGSLRWGQQLKVMGFPFEVKEGCVLN